MLPATSAKPAPAARATRIAVPALRTAPRGEYTVIVATSIMLTLLGLVLIQSATTSDMVAAGLPTYTVAARQGMFALLGIPLMLIVGRIPVRTWKRLAWPAFGATVLFQLLVFVPGIGIENDGNLNWVSIGGLQAQPSEFLKFGLAVWLGVILARKEKRLHTWRHFLIPLAPGALLAIGAVMGGDDLGTAMILVLLVLGAILFSGIRLRAFVWPVIACTVGVLFFALTSPNRMRRIMTFASTSDAECYYDNCYQAMHAIWAVAGGGVWGTGLGGSKAKYWLPAASTDYIFAIGAEELGLVGSIVIFCLFAAYAVAAIRIIRFSDDIFVRTTAGAIASWIVGQTIVNIGVVLGVFPVLGVPLPFLSGGGTSLVAVLLGSGLLLSMARSLPARPPRRHPEPERRPQPEPEPEPRPQPELQGLGHATP